MALLKYIGSIINLANGFSQATRPKHVGQMSELIQQFRDECDSHEVDDWEKFYDGDDNLNSSIRLHRCGGHSAGLQFVSVNTARGWLVLASDATHYYENMNAYRPFTTAFHIGEMMECFDQLKRVAPSEDHIIPGHDPLVMKRYPALSGQEGIIVRLDVPPASELAAAP